jgi:hypothetical protein
MFICYAMVLRNSNCSAYTACDDDKSKFYNSGSDNCGISVHSPRIIPDQITIEILSQAGDSGRNHNLGNLTREVHILSMFQAFRYLPK